MTGMKPLLKECLLAVLAAAALAGCDGYIADAPVDRPRPAPRPQTPRPPQGKPMPQGVKPFRMGTPDIVLLVTGCTNGTLEPCNCTSVMPGGLARRSGLVQRYRAAFGNVFLLDTGDAMWIEKPDDPRNPYLLQGYREIGYDAIVLADQEWSIPRPLLHEYLVPGKMAYLSTTIWPQAGPKLPFVRVVTRKWGDVKLAVFSDIRKEAMEFLGAKKLHGLVFAATTDLTESVAAFKKAGYVVVVTSHGVDFHISATAKSCDADLILPGHIGITELQLGEVAGKPAARVGGSGHVGVFAMKVRGGKVTDLEYRAELVDRRWPGDRKLIHTYQAYSHVAMRRALDAKRKEGLDYVPSARCGKCHKGQYDAWKRSKHAHAWQTLVKAKRNIDPKCLMCHTSGFGTKKGFYTIEKTPNLVNVNCQNCHRFNDAEHRIGDKRRPGFRPPPMDKKVCESCHTKVTHPAFVYKAHLATMGCGRLSHPDIPTKEK